MTTAAPASIPIPGPIPTLVDVTHRVEHVDTDAAGVMHFARYASLLETACLDNLERLGGGVRRLALDGLELAISEVRLNYFASARYFDQGLLRPRGDRVGGASWTMSVTAYRDEASPETVLASGSLVLCLVDRATGAATRIPADIRDELRRHTGSAS